MNAQNVIKKANSGVGLTVEQIKIYQANVRSQKQVYGKYGTLALKYIEEHNVGKLWGIVNLPEYLHGIDRQADELYKTMYAKLSKDARYERLAARLYAHLRIYDELTAFSYLLFSAFYTSINIHKLV